MTGEACITPQPELDTQGGCCWLGFYCFYFEGVGLRWLFLEPPIRHAALDSRRSGGAELGGGKLAAAGVVSSVVPPRKCDSSSVLPCCQTFELLNSNSGNGCE